MTRNLHVARRWWWRNGTRLVSKQYRLRWRTWIDHLNLPFICCIDKPLLIIWIFFHRLYWCIEKMLFSWKFKAVQIALTYLIIWIRFSSDIWRCPSHGKLQTENVEFTNWLEEEILCSKCQKRLTFMSGKNWGSWKVKYEI